VLVKIGSTFGRLDASVLRVNVYADWTEVETKLETRQRDPRSSQGYVRFFCGEGLEGAKKKKKKKKEGRRVRGWDGGERRRSGN